MRHAGMLLLLTIMITGCRPAEDPLESDESAADRIGMRTVVRKDIVVGTGKEAQRGNRITAHYTLWLTNGRKVQSSHDGPGKPFTQMLQKGSLIDGWVIGIPGMREGGKRRLEIPSHLAYGGRAQQGIPAHSDLIFEVELVKVE